MMSPLVILLFRKTLWLNAPETGVAKQRTRVLDVVDVDDIEGVFAAADPTCGQQALGSNCFVLIAPGLGCELAVLSNRFWLHIKKRRGSRSRPPRCVTGRAATDWIY